MVRQGLHPLSRVGSRKNAIRMDIYGFLSAPLSLRLLQSPLPMTQRPSRTVTTFPVAAIERIRYAIQKMQEPLQELPDGWSISPVDPNWVLALFPTLRLRDGRRLIAYQYVAGGNGNGFVFAWPNDTPVPEPPADRESSPFCMERFMARLHSGPAAEDAGEHLSSGVMQAIEGDGSARSYLDASLFCREIHEFGALWHGTDWGTHRLIDRDPFTEGILVHGGDRGSRTRLEPAGWMWEGDVLREWLPAVTMTENESRVEFSTYSGLGLESLNFYCDTYTRGRYVCRSTLRCIARGFRGYVF